MRNIDGRVPCQTGSAGREPSTDPTSQKFIEALGSFLQMTACGSVAASVMSHFDDLSQPAMPEILLNAGLVSTGFRPSWSLYPYPRIPMKYDLDSARWQ